jgi:hypothetical protein
MVPVVTVTSYFSNQRQLAHGQFEKEIDHTELSPQRRGLIIARLTGVVERSGRETPHRNLPDRNERAEKPPFLGLPKLGISGKVMASKGVSTVDTPARASGSKEQSDAPPGSPRRMRVPATTQHPDSTSSSRATRRARFAKDSR